MIFPFILIGIALLSLAIWVWMRRAGKAERERYLKSRLVLPLDEWYRSNFENEPVSKQTVVDVCGHLAQALNCDTTQILASDRFDVELKWPGHLFFGVSPDNEMEYFFTDRLRKILAKDRYWQLMQTFEVPHTVKTPRTVRDLVLACDKLVSAPAS